MIPSSSRECAAMEMAMRWHSISRAAMRAANCANTRCRAVRHGGPQRPGTGADTGFGIDLIAGRASRAGDWRFTYGYAQAETDAVLAAFSHDNTNLATNYLQHTLAADFMPQANLTLNATYYRYRQKDLLEGFGFPDWQNRLRFNLMVGF